MSKIKSPRLGEKKPIGQHPVSRPKHDRGWAYRRWLLAGSGSSIAAEHRKTPDPGWPPKNPPKDPPRPPKPPPTPPEIPPKDPPRVPPEIPPREPPREPPKVPPKESPRNRERITE